MGLDRAAKMNAFDLQMLRELAEALTRYEEDEQLRCAVLHAHGDNFTAGLDLGEVGAQVSQGTPLFPEEYVDPLGLRGRVRTKPLVMAVQGWCLTIGIELLLASDIRIAATGTRFGQIEIARGIFPFGGATLRWPALTGWGDAMRYLLTGDKFGTEEAHRMGLIQEVTPAGAQLDRALELAQTIAKQAPLGVRATLASARKAALDGFEAEAAQLPSRTQALFASEDAAEGLRSFLERREGRFTGR
jgi:enoyl-CoA hydratase/carnithine racemase